MLQLALVVSHGLNRDTDVYFILFTFGQAPLQIYTVGYLQGSRLGSPSGNWLWPALVSAVFSAFAVLIGVAVLAWYSLASAGAQALPLAASSAVAGAAATLAVARNCAGRPRALTSLAILPNIGAVLMLALFRTRGLAGLVPMEYGLLGGNLFYLVCLTVLHSNGRHKVHGAVARGSFTGWLMAASVVGYGGPLALQYAATLSGPGAASVFAVGAKVAYALAAISVMPVLPLLVNWDTFEYSAVRRFSVLLIGGAMLGGAILSFVLPAGSVGKTPIQFVGCIVPLWLALAGSQGLVVRVAWRERREDAFRISVVATVPVFIVGVILTGAGYGLAPFATLFATAAAATVICCLTLGWRTEGAAVLLLTASTLAAASLQTARERSLALVGLVILLIMLYRLRLGAGPTDRYSSL